MPENAEIAARRRRYEELMAAGQTETAKALPPLSRIPAPAVAQDAIAERREIPAGWYWSGRLQRGQALRITNTAGTSSVAFLAWSSADPSERLNHADTAKLQWTTKLQRGRLLLSDMGRVLVSVTEDSCGAHDYLAGGSTASSTEKKYGPGFRNTRDNFILMASKWGLARRDIPPCLTFFAPVHTAESGILTWGEDKRKPGDFIELRAEMDVLIALSNCPHPLDPAAAYPTGSVDAMAYGAPPASVDDFCRTGSAEAIRAFAQTDALYRI